VIGNVLLGSFVIDRNDDDGVLPRSGVVTQRDLVRIPRLGTDHALLAACAMASLCPRSLRRRLAEAQTDEAGQHAKHPAPGGAAAQSSDEPIKPFVLHRGCLLSLCAGERT
jgi:hypothetical protein